MDSEVQNKPSSIKNINLNNSKPKSNKKPVYFSPYNKSYIFGKFMSFRQEEEEEPKSINEWSKIEYECQNEAAAKWNKISNFILKENNKEDVKSFFKRLHQHLKFQNINLSKYLEVNRRNTRRGSVNKKNNSQGKNSLALKALHKSSIYQDFKKTNFQKSNDINNSNDSK